MEPEVVVDKLEAARRQLEVALRLYFANDDPIAIHTLTAAGYNLLRDLNAVSGGGPMIVKQQLLAFVKPEYQDLIRSKMNAAENFLKHANRDPGATLRFRALQTEFLLLDACWKYAELSGKQVPIFAVFAFWFVIRNPHQFRLPSSMESIRAMAASDYGPADRAKFVADMLPLTSQEARP